MKLFSFVTWVAWAAIVLRVLLAPYWMLTVEQGMFLLLVIAPAVGFVFLLVHWLIGWTEQADPRLS